VHSSPPAIEATELGLQFRLDGSRDLDINQNRHKTYVADNDVTSALPYPKILGSTLLLGAAVGAVVAPAEMPSSSVAATSIEDGEPFARTEIRRFGLKAYWGM
jgi:hypothetical protein